MKRLPEAEEIIMSIIWRTETELTMAEIREQAEAKYKKVWKPQTVSTLLARLRNKQYIYMYHRGRQCFYGPLINKDDYSRSVFQTFIDYLYDGNVQKFKEETMIGK